MHYIFSSVHVLIKWYMEWIIITLFFQSRKDDVWVGHLLSGYSLPMEDPSQAKGEANVEIGGTWKASILAAYEATRSAFPGGEILAHLDVK